MHASPSSAPLRRARMQALLVLALAAALALTPLASAPAQAEDARPTFQGEGDRYVVDITFPHEADAGHHYVDTYDACRSGCSRTHRATDIMVDKHTPTYAVVDGEICYAPGIDEPEPSYGYMISLCGDDGFRYAYVHLNNDTPGTDDGQGGPEHAYAPGIERGARVERGDLIGWAGDSGNAENTGSHIHFEIHEERDGDVRINPFESLKAAEERGDYPSSPTPMSGGDTPADTEQDGGEGWTRLAGGNRLQTAVALSAEVRDDGRTVVVVPAGSHVEALVAAPLAGLTDAPILLAAEDGLEAGVADEVARLGARNAYVIGTAAQLSEQVEADLEAAGVQNLARIARTDRYALSAAVAREIASYPIAADVDHVILAVGEAAEQSREWPDALSASALAAHTRTPVLLTRGDSLPAPIADLLTEHKPSRITVVGGTAAISTEVEREAEEVADGAATRIAGATRYATSVAVADAAVDAGLDAGAAWVATGRNFPDALAAGPAAAKAGAPLLLVDGEDVDGAPESRRWLEGRGGELVVVGGRSVVSDEVARALSS